MRIDWISLLVGMGISTTVVLPLLVWLTKTLLAHELAKTLEKTKQQLQLQNQIEQIKFSRLQERQAEVIHELYKRIIRVRRMCHHFIEPANQISKGPEDYKAVQEIFAEVIKTNFYFGENALYFPEHLKKKYRLLFTKGIIKPLHVVATMEMLDASVKKLRPEMGDVVKDFVPTLRKELEEIDVYIAELEREFHKLLGLNQL